MMKILAVMAGLACDQKAPAVPWTYSLDQVGDIWNFNPECDPVVKDLRGHHTLTIEEIPPVAGRLGGRKYTLDDVVFGPDNVIWVGHAHHFMSSGDVLMDLAEDEDGTARISLTTLTSWEGLRGRHTCVIMAELSGHLVP